MKIAEFNSSNISKKPQFASIYTSKTAKNVFNFAQENAPLFIAGTTLAMTTLIRPLAIFSAPDTDKENKRYAAAKSIASGIAGFGIMLLFSLPLTKTIKKIDNNPEKFLTKNTIKNLKLPNFDLKNSKPYIVASQLLKLGAGMVITVPKTLLTCALIMPVAEKMHKQKKPKAKTKQKIAFKGQIFAKINSDYPTRLTAKFFNSDFVQKFSQKIKNSNFEMAMIALTDIFATGCFVFQNNKNKKMNETRKKVLNKNAVYSTGLSILGACTLDKLLDKKTETFINNFKKANPTLKNLENYAEGIRITKKVFLLGVLYYAVIPLLATFFADRTVKGNKKPA